MLPVYVAICFLITVKMVNHIPEWNKSLLISYTSE